MQDINKYFEEIKEDLKLDQINILEKQLSLPAIKHKWVSFLIKSKIQRNELEKKKKEIKEIVLKKYTQDNNIPTGIPKASIKAKIEASDSIKKIDDDLKDLDVIIDYLEKVEKIFTTFSYDISNATKLMILETT
jgi:hypothetical protein